MSIEWFSSLVICIFGIAATVVLIFIGILAFMLYRKISPILDSSKAAVKTVKDISDCVEDELARPLAHAAAFVQGIYQAVGLLGRFTRKNRG